jgi:hypothetical protein
VSRSRIGTGSSLLRRVAHSYPALDQIAAEPVTDIIGMDCLLVRERKIIGINVKGSARDWQVRLEEA